MTDIPRIATPARTHAIMERFGFHTKKHLGQNFLTNLDVLSGIVAAAGVDEHSDVIEIGPGIGSLTQYLAEAAHQVLALEIDEALLPVLDETMAPYPNVTVENQDVLTANLRALIEQHFDGQHSVKVVANLPYYITTPILMHLMQIDIDFESITVMMQGEVADRLTAQPGSKDYSSLSIAIQNQMTVQVAFTVNRRSFVPAPNVDSAIIVLQRRAEPLADVDDQAGFNRLVRGSFASRRKTLWNNLQQLYGKDADTKAAMTAALADSDIAPGLRAERLSITDFARLFNSLQKQHVA
ncbi:16S rRNA (adenine(1518)-N(6)/adenine(1519)-N(6))-dimethyltransferase RsmA [Lacticaseibacillus pantheris]|jgi:16S rRNA (adenine1518-N6/adenine1519-N6)-dimethyltransferase|uniref:Ribosomal RNA small subunit methyltransferase A n=1 Tax=Lacticaseibacillus pantheris DSM 15945 = JCM 12539 = NBRC 106106 TaxID=1423783 RepID=A0A0R1U3L1_9LACO|nr:16S rRNA (adenine(1518)-N(6)/adenine(1519)-N(6))-dimethyltransferase RsmA [Lacticaseibacillus pantheris]KRL86058.1 dimethyladenosine transferase (rRNA methylation) [Lacticaseibacillus pantheris DSM 15945 = JCM 12539 = NBRC 106106]WKF85293.1 16S rRNA (adenine(1518)-N(6)/adenine(1519)-N(6))-dimethyltransferase RsmA [Lacticaseibacillus pantheris]